ncbi:putative dihydroflavonol-4-reductase [Diplonema papillatum]|nr:putative dihydroflavonol-4-reductase [Diplonema papillatum]
MVDRTALADATPEKADYFFHLASNTAVRKEGDSLQNQVNIRGTENAVSVCQEKQIGRFMLTSSIAVYFPATHEYEGWLPPKRKRVILTEESQKSPDDFWVNYCRTKALQEKIVQASDLDFVILQPSDIVGRYDDRSWGRLVRMMADCRLVGVPKTKLNFVNVVDVVEGHFKAAVQGKPRETYILGGTPFETTELISEMMCNVRRIIGSAPCTPKAVPLLLLSFLGCVQDWLDDDPLAETCNTPEADKSFPRETIFLLSSQHTTSSEKARRAFGYQATDHKGVVLAIREMADYALAHHGQITAPTNQIARLRKHYHLTKQQVRKLLSV